jgi:ABC-type bacteriocin/lantibiotic exporter with double-glycine peptidase domain
MLAEAEPIGGFVGESISEPMLQVGLLVAVTSYLVYLQPLMALVVVMVFCPQIGFVPFMQAAINKRIRRRVGVLREISKDIVNAGSAKDEEGLQHLRIQNIFAMNMGIYKIKFGMNFLMNLMTHLGYVGIFGTGAYFVITGKTEMGTIVAFISGLSKINDPWGELVTWYRSLQATRVTYRLIQEAVEIGAIMPASGVLFV